jgi:hypothetical protein
VNPGRLFTALFKVSAVCCAALASLTAFAQTKYIHLRNEVIATQPAGKPAAPAVESAAAGLFLIQFEGHPLASWRSVLKTNGVDLVKYIPEDAYIARITNTSLARVRGLSFVRWVGPYRPEHKVHPRLSASVKSASNTNLPVAINILLSPRATDDELRQVRAMLSRVDNESRLRQGVIVRGNLPPAFLTKLAQLDSVLWIEPAPHRKLVDELASKIVGGDDGLTGTPTVTEQMNFGGGGVTVCVTDTGLDTGNTNTMHPDVRGRVSGFQFYGSLTDGSDGYGHGTHCAGIVAGNAATGETDPATGAWYGLGVASQTTLFIERIFDENANEVTPAPSDATLARDAVRNGAQIGSASWGNDVQGEYDMDAAQFDELARDADAAAPGDQPYVLEFSAGNAGPDSQTLDSPATGKNVIATGASETVSGTESETYGLYDDGPDTMADFSSRGPCEDGRIKPDLVAPGTWIASMASSAAPDEASIAWMTIDSFYVYMGGTSMSGPFASGAAADFIEYYWSTHTNATPSPALVKAALINSARELDENNGGPGPIPNNDEGWGRITLTNIIGSSRVYEYVDQTALLSTGQEYDQHLFVQNSDQPLKITLAYTDVAGFPGAIPALVNNLDLQVIGPDGTVYRGNQFTDGESTPNATAADALNNVEGVQLAQPAPGNYLVRILAVNVPEDARLDTAEIDQDFALVMSGNLLAGHQGEILLDRTNYTAPGIIHLQVLDAGRAASNAVTVLVKSTTEPLGEHITLLSAGGYGAFTGMVTTVVGSPMPDGKLEIHNGDAIEADYTDSSGTLRSATAQANLIAPVITGVTTNLDNGLLTISWQTSEAASSTVYYGTNPAALNLSATDPTLTTDHSLILANLTVGATYYFVVASTDEAGNSATNNNSGNLYAFVAVPTPPVLLIDDYDDAGEQDAGSPVIPASTYTNALAAAGFSFAYWKVIDRGPPQLSDLQPFHVVIWRTTDDIINYTGTNNTLTPQQQVMIESYLNGGGSFFMASMGILSQLGDVPFRQSVLQVGGFLQNPDPPSPCSCDEDFGVPAFQGAPGNPITTGMNIALDYSSYPIFDLGDGTVYGPDFSDTFTPVATSTAITFETVSGKPCGASYPPTGVNSPGRIVFLSFPLDAVPESGPSPDNEVVLLRNILNFLDPGANGVGVIWLDNNIYTIPDVVTVEVGDSDLAGSGHAQVTFSTSSATNLVTITLNETPHPGLFQSAITLVGSNTTAAAQLHVKNGDTITASYFDASSHSNVTATAAVDTVPPIITQVQAATNIGSAVITWNTSTPADSLVEYGVPLLNQSVYNAQLVTSHSITLSGLAANRTYYYSVTSRDQAGNSATADNQGALYSFVTPPTLQPPWSDNFQNGINGWSVVPDPTYGSDINWTFGTPNNGLQTSGYDGPNCWGSLLQGPQQGFLFDSFLYSPFIDLSGYSQITLTFWDCGDFSSGLEEGQVLVSTSSSLPPDALPQAQDFSSLDSDDWERESVDLTPWAGQTVQVVWNYAGANIGSPLYGWLVDDVAINGISSGESGTIVVSKNLGSGSFNLTGAISQSGTALSTTLSNAPPGQYSVQFGDVAFFITPASQTNTLAPGGTLTFTGTYTFPDVNSNGISDLFEQYYFGNISTNRTRSTDTDKDGMSDYAEFIAGTDPTNPDSNLRFVKEFQAGGQVTFQWSAIPGRIYQVESSTNLATWTPVTDWVQALSSPMSYTATNASQGHCAFRVQVRP